MARLSAFRAGAFKAQTFNSIWGKPATAHSGSTGVDFAPKFGYPLQDSQEDDIILTVVAQALAFMVAKSGRF